jgi:uncharacterized lipoprotein YddW (UPF0748 family)
MMRSGWLVCPLFACALALVVLPALTHAQTVTVDNSDPEFTLLSGDWESGAFGTPYGADYNWSLTTAAGGNLAAAEWRPDLPLAGAWEVQVYYVAGGNRAADAPYTVYHAVGSTSIDINQQINGEAWVSLGTHTFAAGTGGYVRLTNGAGLSVVIADAVRFIRVTDTVTLTMAVTPSGWGLTQPTMGAYDRFLGETVEIDAAPLTGYVFDRWQVSGGVAPADIYDPTTTVVMDQSKTVTAVFQEVGAVPPEFRGFWAYAFGTGFKSQSQIQDMVARAVAGNYNAILPEVLAFHDNVGNGHGAYWNSSIVPKATDINGSFDPLAYLVQVAHANGIEVHPWLVTYRISSSWPPGGNNILAAHPEWTMVRIEDMGGGPAEVDNYYVLDPGSPDVQEYLMSIVRELVGNYDVDGIHWDYIRYTTPEAGYPAYTWYNNSGLERFKRITGYSGTPSTGNNSWEDFRRREVTELVRRAWVEMAAASSNPQQPLRQTAALITWGNAPSNFSSTSSWARFQDWRTWMDEGYLDAGIPMTYYDNDVYPGWYQNWVDQSLVWRYDRHIFTGPGIYYNDFADSVSQIQYALNAGVDGICTYSYTATSDTGTDWSWYTSIAPSVFPSPAPTPPMPWRDPATATEGTVYGRVVDGLTGEPVDDANVTFNGFPLVETDGNGFYVMTQRAAGVDGTLWPIGASVPGYATLLRPNVLVKRAAFTEVNFAVGDWKPGDHNVDGMVDGDDFLVWQRGLSGPDNAPTEPGVDLFDFDLDVDIDLPDAAVFQTGFGS